MGTQIIYADRNRNDYLINTYPLETLVQNKTSLPDRYKSNSLILTTPKNDFVISRSEDGKILSVYGDNTWDLNPYISNPSQYATLKFEVIGSKHDYIKEIKKLLFAFIILGSGRKGSTYSVTTISSLLNQALIPLAKFADKKNTTLINLLESIPLLKEYKNSINSKSKLIYLKTLLKFLYIIDNKILQINYSEDIELLSDIQNKLNKIHIKLNQTSVIPSRILANSIKQRWQQISEIEENLDSIVEFTRHFLRTECFAIASSNYRKFNCHNKAGSCTWEHALEKYSLQNIFKKYGIKKRGMFQGFIKKIQGTCKHLIHAYTGMRNGEVLNLTTNCIEKLDNGKIVRLISITTKMTGRKQKVQWVTTKEIERVINILSSINKVILTHYNIEDKNPALFIKTSLLASTSRNTKKNIASIGFKDIDQLPLDESNLIITKEDMSEIEMIDYNINFKHQDTIAIGKIWKFKSHQYRRSLAVYTIQSGIVSLGTLQLQFKHLFREMSMYYGNGASNAKNIIKLSKDHISDDIVKLKPEIDALTFIKEVIFSDEQLFGAGGVFIEKNLKNNSLDIKTHLLKNRENTIKKFKNGDIAYKETAIGGCLSTKICDEYITSSLTACANCEFGVIKPSKIDKVIEKQKAFINCLQENSIEHRTELWQLKELEAKKKALIGENHECT